MKFAVSSMIPLMLVFSGSALGGSKSITKDYTVSSKTNIDFNETLIDGQMKAPSGFFLQGRKSQSLSQMVRLRSNFRRELTGSGAGVKSRVK